MYSPEPFSRLSQHAEQFASRCNCLCCFSLPVISTIEFSFTLVGIKLSDVLTKEAGQSDYCTLLVSAPSVKYQRLKKGRITRT